MLVSREQQLEVDLFFLLTRFDTIASVMASHQRSKQEFSSPRQIAKVVQQREQFTTGFLSWLMSSLTTAFQRPHSTKMDVVQTKLKMFRNTRKGID